MKPAGRVAIQSLVRRWPVALLAAVLLTIAACGGATTPASPTPAPVTPTPAATPGQVSPAASAAPSPTPEASLAAFTSIAYGYRAVLPGTWRPTQALEPWDGKARIDSNGPYTDQIPIPGSILFFAYGAPTDLALDAYAAEAQAQVAEWHGCPSAPESAIDLAVDGAPGRLHRFECSGLLVQKLMAVRDGRGLVLNMLAPPQGETDPRALFEEIVAGIAWPD